MWSPEQIVACMAAGLSVVVDARSIADPVVIISQGSQHSRLVRFEAPAQEAGSPWPRTVTFLLHTQEQISEEDAVESSIDYLSTMPIKGLETFTPALVI